MLLNMLMPSVMCSHFSMQELDVILVSKCHVSFSLETESDLYM